MAEISIIIPVYQVEKYIRRCLDSLLAQTFSDFEAILVDDGSTDQSGAICEEYARKDPRFVVFHQKNQGQSVARNYALDWVYANSDSRYISFVDSDDWVHPKYLELLLQAVNKYEVNISQCLYLRTDGTATAPDVGNRSLLVTAEEQYINWYSAFFHTKLYVKSCLEHVRFPEGQVYEDTAIWYKVLFREKNIAIVKETLYYYYINPGSTTHSMWKPARLAQVKAWEDQILFFEQHNMQNVHKCSLRLFCGVLLHQSEEVRSSKAISPLQKLYYKRLLAHKLARLLRKYTSEIKQLGVYSDCVPYAYPHLAPLIGYVSGIKKKLRK